MPTRPLIGLSTSQPGEGPSGGFNGVSRRYAEAVRLAGGIPLLLPNLPEVAADYAARVDAVLLTGGVDVHPRHYGQAPTGRRRDVGWARWTRNATPSSSPCTAPRVTWAGRSWASAGGCRS